MAFEPQPSVAMGAPITPAQQPDTGVVTQIDYHDAVPPSIAAELDSLYRHINCSLSHFRFQQRAMQANTYVAREGGRTTAIFVHVRKGSSVTVLNEMVALDAHDIAQFARHVFARFRAVSCIRFSLIGKEVGRLPFPFQQHGGSEDIVIALPKTPEAYFSSLSAKTRQNIKHRHKTLQRDHPGLRFVSYHDGDIDPRHVAALVELKRRQFREKRLRCGLEDDEAAWIADRARRGGLLTLAMLGDRVCGGSVSHRIGDSYFAALAAYDAAFARHGLGLLCCYETICEKIALGARKTHLGWGRNEYKFKLLGVRQDMANLDVYRSRLAWLGQAHRVAGHALRTRLQQAKWYLLEQESATGPLAPITRAIVRTARAIKRSRSEPEA